MAGNGPEKTVHLMDRNHHEYEIICRQPGLHHERRRSTGTGYDERREQGQTAPSFHAPGLEGDRDEIPAAGVSPWVVAGSQHAGSLRGIVVPDVSESGGILVASAAVGRTGRRVPGSGVRPTAALATRMPPDSEIG